MSLLGKKRENEDGALKPSSAGEAAMGFDDLPAEIQDFLTITAQRPERICTFGERFNCVVELLCDLVPLRSRHIFETRMDIAPLFYGHIFVTHMDTVTKEDVKSFAATAYNHNYHRYLVEMANLARKIRGADSGPPAFVILITGNVLEGDLRKLIPGDWTGQTNKAMIYDFSKKILYGRNGVHMKFFKKVLEEWGDFENLQSDEKYFGLRLQ